VRRAHIVGLLLGLAAIGGLGDGCYSPDVAPGKLMCAKAPAKACPDGFVCSGTVCIKAGAASGSGGTAAGTGGSGSGTGGAGGQCANPLAPLCSATPSGSAGCDPVCQTGCGCDLQCAVVGAGTACVPTGGAKLIGSTCQPGSSECAPGLACLEELCGTGLGRCYRYCNDASVCPSGVCGIPIEGSDQHVCNIGDLACDPYARTGCPDPALNCYVTSPNHTACDCPTGKNVAQGESCMYYNDCALGLACIKMGAAARCFKLCRNASDCAGCTGLGASIGYCP